MWCPRLNHFVRFNPDGTVSRCGHMVDAPKFQSLTEMDHSPWGKNLQAEMMNDIWPRECVRCQETEAEFSTSIRLHAWKTHKEQTRKDYLIVGGVLDNTCNSACMTCNDQLSTKIGSLKSRQFPIVDNSDKFWNLPLERIEHLMEF